MAPVSFYGLALITAVAFAIPLLLGFFPRIKMPSAVLEIAAGVILGPSVLGWVRVDPAVQVMSAIGLGALLFLAGLEIEFSRMKGKPLQLAGIGFLLSLILAAGAGLGLKAIGMIESPSFIAIVLAATALGIIVPILKDAGQISTEFGQLVVAAASISDFGTVILLSLLFSREASGAGTQMLLLSAFVLLSVTVLVLALRSGRSTALSSVMVRLQNTTAQIRIRGAAFLLVALLAVAQRFGLETILGAFIAGSIVSLIDTDQNRTHPLFRTKLEAIGFGIFVPVFFVTSGIRFNLKALVGSPAGLAQIPVYLLALLVVRGIPAWIYRGFVTDRQAIAAAFLQATSLSFIVASVQIGLELRVINEPTGAALVAAALLSVFAFPLAAGIALRGSEPAT
jgi:Kef-type K+ transport system membrane component KefB